MCCSSSWMTPALGILAVTAAPSPHPTWTAWRKAGCVTAICTPRRSVRPPAPASSPGATITPTTWPASPRARPAILVTMPISPSRMASLSEMLLQQGYNTYAVGKWHLTPSTRSRQPGPTTAGLWGVASSATTAFWVATRTNTTPNWSTTTTPSSRRKHRKKAIT